MDENNQVNEPSATEVEARAAGWVPKDDYVGDENKWVDADEFVRRGPLFEKINHQNRELKEVKKTLAQLAAHHAAVKETAYKDALATLKAQKRDAFVEGDADKIIEIDEKIDDVKSKQRQFANEQTQAVQEAAQIHPEFEAWTNRNTWYNTSTPMKAFADALGVELRQSGKSPSEVLKEVEKQVREEFPNKFQNKNRERPGTVEGTSKGSNSQTSAKSSTLSDVERKVMNSFVRAGIMTEEAYIAELKRTKEKE